MSEKAVLIEQSLADAIGMIAAADELPEHTRRHWPTSLRKIAQALDKPLEMIPARYSAIRADLIHLHHVPAGLHRKNAAESQKQCEERAPLSRAREGNPAVRRPVDRGLAEIDWANRGRS